MTPEELGTAIRRRRREVGITQRQLALAAGTGLRFIGELEAGKPSCQLGKALEVVRALGLRLDLRTPEGGP